MAPQSFLLAEQPHEQVLNLSTARDTTWSRGEGGIEAGSVSPAELLDVNPINTRERKGNI